MMSSGASNVIGGLFAISLCAGTVTAGVRYVDDDAPPAGDGQTWATAYRFLQDALAEAAGGDVTEIRVARGLYRPDRDEANPDGTGDRMATFQLVVDVPLVGGHAGIGAPDPDERNVPDYVTTLSGDLLGDDGPDFTNNGDNSWHVVTVAGKTVAAIIDGVTITAGAANGPNEAGKLGGGMTIHDGSHAEIVRSTFIGNFAFLAGGAIRCGESTVTISSSSFINNRAESPNRGGGAIASFKSVLSITGGLFHANYTGGEGGVLAHIDGVATIRNSTLIGNRAETLGGGGLCTMHVDTKGGTTTVVNCILFGNWAPKDPQIFNRAEGDETHVSWSNTEGGLGGAGVFDHGGNIDAEPVMVDPDNGDFRLASGSPGVDAGDNDAVPAGITEDLDGNPRFQDDCDTADTGQGKPPIVDMGAYELSGRSCCEDLDRSGAVDFGDILAVLTAWANTGGPEDLDGSGFVGFGDLLIVLASWGPC